MADNFSTAKLGLGVDTKQFNKDLGNTSTKVEKALEKMKLSADAFSERWGSLTAGIKDTKRIVSGILISQSFMLYQIHWLLLARQRLLFPEIWRQRLFRWNTL